MGKMKLIEGKDFLKNYYGGKFGEPNCNITEVASDFDVSQESVNLYIKEKFDSNNRVEEARV